MNSSYSVTCVVESVFELLCEKDRERLHAARIAADKSSDKITERYSAQSQQDVSLSAAVPAVTSHLLHAVTSHTAVSLPHTAPVSLQSSQQNLRVVTTSTLGCTYPGQLGKSTSAPPSRLAGQPVSSTHALPDVQAVSTGSSASHVAAVNDSVNSTPTAAAGKVFEPFARDPVKQARYKVYLEMTRAGRRGRLLFWQKIHHCMR